MADDGGQHVALFIDLDRFKVINDTCGHAAGDRLLKQAAATMRGQLRPRDLLTRFGSDEFVALLCHCTLARALDTAERLRAALEGSRFAWESGVFAATASIGAVVLDRPATVAGTISRASAACHMAREKGRNRAHVHRAGDAELQLRQDEMGWVGRLRAALDEDRFVLYGQRIAPLRGGEDAPHYEVLVRLCDREGVAVPPMAFIPADERYGLMPAIDRRVLEQALAYLAAQARDGRRPRPSVNVSGHTLGSDGFIDFVERAFARHGVPPSQVCFEITETAAVANLGRADVHRLEPPPRLPVLARRLRQRHVPVRLPQAAPRRLPEDRRLVRAQPGRRPRRRGDGDRDPPRRLGDGPAHHRRVRRERGHPRAPARARGRLRPGLRRAPPAGAARRGRVVGRGRLTATTRHGTGAPAHSRGPVPACR
ncbi:MAG TPA: diguanylate cyclase [Lysobacter sp.]